MRNRIRHMTHALTPTVGGGTELAQTANKIRCLHVCIECHVCALDIHSSLLTT